MGEASLVERVEIQRTLLMAVLAIAQHMGAIPRTSEGGGEHGFIHRRLVLLLRGLHRGRLRPMLGGPLINGGVVGSGVGKGLACKPTTFFECEAFSIADAAGNQRIVALFLAAARTIVGPPISIFSIVSASLAPERTVSANGYRFTTTKSNGLMPNCSNWAA